MLELLGFVGVGASLQRGRQRTVGAALGFSAGVCGAVSLLLGAGALTRGGVGS